MLDDSFPDTDRVIPTPSGNTAIVNVAALIHAVECVKAVAGTESKAVPLVGLEWNGEPSAAYQLGRLGTADDFVDAEISGVGKVALNAESARRNARGISRQDHSPRRRRQPGPETPLLLH